MHAIHLGDSKTFNKVSTSLYLGGVSTTFKLIHDYSSFNEFLEIGEEIIEKFKMQNKEVIRINLLAN